MIDRLYARFRGSQPWTVVLAEGVVERARADVRALFKDAGPQRAMLERLAATLTALERDPLRVLGHPPLGTEDPNVFRYSADPQASISVIADLDLRRRELVIVLIKLKGARHGRH